MATNQVTFTISPEKCSIGNQCEHEITSSVIHTVIKKEFTNTNTVTSELNIPLSLPESAIITSIVFPLNDYSYGSVKPSNSCMLIVENTQYELNTTGEVVNNSIYSHLNNYKAQHGFFPPIIFRITSTTTITETQEATAVIVITPFKVTCEISGKEVVLRPSEDVSVEHAISLNAYSLINETVADDDATVIEDSVSSTTLPADQIKTTIVKLDVIPETNKILNITFNLRANTISDKSPNCAFAEMWLEIDGAVSSSISTIPGEIKADGTLDFITYECALDAEDDFVKAINRYYTENNIMPELRAHLLTSVSAVEDKYSSANQARITQAYATVIYETSSSANMNIYYKVNGVWKQAIKAYQKQSGSWVEITEEECKTILNPTNT